jgi:hypothetical protein
VGLAGDRLPGKEPAVEPVIGQHAAAKSGNDILDQAILGMGIIVPDFYAAP